LFSGRCNRPEEGLPSADAVLEEVDRVLTSSVFTHAARLSRFLKYGVECALAGRTDVNEYAIGVDVFGRPPSFDPRIDPIVRVDARRLRSKLREYYENEGAGDSLEICLPLRTYIPVFRKRSPEPLPEPPVEGGPRILKCIIVFPITALSTDREDHFFAEGLNQEVIHALATRTEFRIVAGEAAPGPARPDVRNCAAYEADAAAWGTVRRVEGAYRISAEMFGIPDRTILWSHIFQEKLDGAVSAQPRIAGAISEALQLTRAEAGNRHDLSATIA
jgi:TolB-like protein